MYSAIGVVSWWKSRLTKVVPVVGPSEAIISPGLATPGERPAPGRSLATAPASTDDDLSTRNPASPVP
jgi:hypothetical protein